MHYKKISTEFYQKQETSDKMTFSQQAFSYSSDALTHQITFVVSLLYNVVHAKENALSCASKR
jgi:hypothetical protein